MSNKTLNNQSQLQWEMQAIDQFSCFHLPFIDSETT